MPMIRGGEGDIQCRAADLCSPDSVDLAPCGCLGCCRELEMLAVVLLRTWLWESGGTVG